MPPDTTNTSAVSYMAFGFGQPLTAVRTTVNDTDYTIIGKDAIVAMTAITASRTFTLPTTSSMPRGWQVIIKDESGDCSNDNSIVIAGTIDNQTDLTLDSAYATATLYTNGTGWFRIA